MACVLTPQCNFLYEYFLCQSPEDTIDMEVFVWTMKGIHSFKKDHAMQLIPCRPWTSRHHPYPSLTKKMRTYLVLKDHVADPSQPNPTYTQGPNMTAPQKVQTHGTDKGEMKKTSKTSQVSKR